jgi:5-methylcytosine-specific restriction enzyme A
MKPYLKQGCHVLIEYPAIYCEKHKPKHNDTYRPSAYQRGYTGAWRRYRQAFLIKSPLCAECMRRGLIREAKVVDHITPHKGNMDIFWDESNHQSLCIRCHNKKTATKDGGFGRKRIK